MAQLNVDVTPQLKKDLDIYCANSQKKRKEVVAMALALFLSNSTQAK